MTLQDLVTVSLWATGLAGGVIGFVGLIYYGIAFARLALDRRRSRKAQDTAPVVQRPQNTAGRSATVEN